MTNLSEPVEMKFQTVAGEVKKAVEARTALRATNTQVTRVTRSYNIDTDVEHVRVELTFEIKGSA